MWDHINMPTQKLCEGKYFFTVDLTSGYYQVELAEKGRAKLLFVHPRVILNFFVCPWPEIRAVYISVSYEFRPRRNERVTMLLLYGLSCY
jgi:hypothetical protein